MFGKTLKYHNDMGDGYDEVVILADPPTGDNVRIIHLGRLYDGMLSSTNVQHMDEKGRTGLAQVDKPVWYHKFLPAFLKRYVMYKKRKNRILKRSSSNA